MSEPFDVEVDLDESRATERRLFRREFLALAVVVAIVIVRQLWLR